MKTASSPQALITFFVRERRVDDIFGLSRHFFTFNHTRNKSGKSDKNSLNSEFSGSSTIIPWNQPVIIKRKTARGEGRRCCEIPKS